MKNSNLDIEPYSKIDGQKYTCTCIYINDHPENWTGSLWLNPGHRQPTKNIQGASKCKGNICFGKD